MTIIEEEGKLILQMQEPREYQIQMMQRVDVLLPFRQEEDQLIWSCCEWEGGEKEKRWISLKELLRTAPTALEFEIWVHGFLRVLESMEWHFLCETKLLIDERWIYRDQEKNLWRLVYIPEEQADQEGVKPVSFLRQLSELILRKAAEHHWEDGEAIVRAFRFYECTVEEEGNNWLEYFGEELSGTETAWIAASDESMDENSFGEAPINNESINKESNTIESKAEDAQAMAEAMGKAALPSVRRMGESFPERWLRLCFRWQIRWEKIRRRIFG